MQARIRRRPVPTDALPVGEVAARPLDATDGIPSRIRRRPVLVPAVVPVSDAVQPAQLAPIAPPVPPPPRAPSPDTSQPEPPTVRRGPARAGSTPSRGEPLSLDACRRSDADLADVSDAELTAARDAFYAIAQLLLDLHAGSRVRV